jgi:membrane dipeptidase
MNNMKNIIYLMAVCIMLTACNTGSRKEAQIEKRKQLHQELLTIDTHTDTPLRLVREGADLSVRNDARRGGGKIDFPRMKEGGLDGIFFAAYVGQGPRDQEGNEQARQEVMEIIDSIHAVIRRYPDIVQLALTADDLERINNNGRLAIFIGIENGYTVGNDISLVRKYYDLGARYITLCHTSNNDICDSSTDRDGPEHEGLSEFGKEVVKEMNRLGMIIDVSHISDDAFYDVVDLSQVPVIASHSGSRSICDHPRNLDDNMLLALAENGGVIQVCLVGEYVREMERDPRRDSARQAVVQKHGNYYELEEEARDAFLVDWYAVDSIFPPNLPSVSDYVDHIDHIVQIAGINHVGIGSDYDGGGGLADCFDVSEMGNITYELLNRGYSAEEIQKIWSGNFLRVFREVEEGKED